MKNNKKVLWMLIVSLLMLALSARGGGEPDAPPPEPKPSGDAAHGEELFVTCLACHGEGGVGIEGLGKDMTSSEFIQNQSEQELLDFIKIGRTTSDPENTTGVDMPPKGGNPALSDDDLLDIIAYIRSIQK